MLHNSRRRCAKVQIPDEELDRYDATVIGTRLIALANTLTRKIDQLAIAAIEAALTKYSIAGVPGHHWGELVTVGLFDSITPNAERPVANISNIALFARVDDLDIKPPDTLVQYPQQSCRSATAPSSPPCWPRWVSRRYAPACRSRTGTGYVVSSGSAGVLGFERPLTTEVISKRELRAQWVQTDTHTAEHPVPEGRGCLC